MLDISNVYGVYPSRKSRSDFVAIKDLSLKVQPGEFVSLVGPSGCGKSTLLRMVAGLETPFSGSILIDGKKPSELAQKPVMVWQDFGLFEWRTVSKNVQFALEMRGVKRKQRRESAQHYVDLVGLSRFADSYPAQLSGGMKQRAALARALASESDILLMDEPFGALDAQTRSVMQEEFLSIWERAKKTVLFVTHSLEEAMLMSDRIVLMTIGPGKIKESVPIDLPRPRDLEVQRSDDYRTLYERLSLSLHEEVSVAVSRELSGETP